MGRRGPPPRPTRLKLLANTWRADRAVPHEPEPKAGIPRAPKHLSKGARAAWPKFAKLLNDMGVLSVADGIALERVCETYAETVTARRTLDAAGWYTTVATKSGTYETRHPAVQVLQQADRRLRAWLAEFGLTPAARTRVSAAEAPRQPNPFDLIDGPPGRRQGRGA